MGLDIRCYTNIKELSESEDVDELNLLDINTFYCNNHVEHLSQIKNLKNGTYYSGDYHRTNVSYPYSTHNKFRVELLKISDNIKCLRPPMESDRHEFDIDFYAMLPEDSFYEFVFFSDCEGLIDWECCGRILKDFEKYYEEVNKLPNMSYNLFKERYNDWIDALKFCYENKGVIEFS